MRMFCVAQASDIRSIWCTERDPPLGDDFTSCATSFAIGRLFGIKSVRPGAPPARFQPVLREAACRLATAGPVMR